MAPDPHQFWLLVGASMLLLGVFLVVVLTITRPQAPARVNAVPKDSAA